MRIVVVGGSSSKVGKTMLACRLIAHAAIFGSVAGLKVSAHENRHAYRVATYLPEEVRAGYSFARSARTTDTGRYLDAGAEVALLLEAGVDDFRSHFAAALRRVRDVRPSTLVIESTLAGAELGLRHESWFVVGSTLWKPRAVRHFARAQRIVREHELGSLAMQFALG